jgi:hypothetical protein
MNYFPETGIVLFDKYYFILAMYINLKTENCTVVLISCNPVRKAILSMDKWEQGETYE